VILKINWFLISSGSLQKQPNITSWPTDDLNKLGESWFDVEEATPEELKNFLAPLDLHPVMMNRCLDSTSTPGVISYDRALLLEFPAALNLNTLEPSYLTILLQSPVLVTIRAGSIPAIEELINDLKAEKTPSLSHLIQIVYLLIDDLADLSIQAETEIRDKTLNIARTLAENPDTVSNSDLTNLRWQVDKLVSLIENQLYCVTGLNSSDNKALQEPHRKAYIQDLVSELEIAQGGIHRLETRVNGLYDSYQTVGSSRVEKRLRILTIVSAITLPFSLIAGLLGMNVGGLPATQDPWGFVIVVGLMFAIGAVELFYFKRKGWLD
jgi:magnesium/cobalt transport protein CorA